MLPVARGAGNAFIFWRVVGPAATWRLIVTDEEFTQWSEFDGGLLDLLHQVTSVHSDSPKFVSMDSLDIAARAAVPASLWDQYPLQYGPPRDVLDELTEDFAPTGANKHDWTGLQLPSDYRRFIDRFGPGRVADIEIVSPFAPGRWSMAALNDRPVPTDSKLVLGDHIGGLILWGSTPDGWFCAWAVSSNDPDLWGVVIVSPDFIQFEYPGTESFSSLLLEYTSTAVMYSFLGREPFDRSRTWQTASELP